MFLEIKSIYLKMNDRLIKIITGYKKKLDKLIIEDHVLFIKEINNLYNNLMVLEKDSFYNELERIKILNDFKKWKDFSASLLEEVTVLKIDPIKNTITLSKEDVIIEEELEDIGNYIKSKNIKPFSFDYYFALCFLSEPSNFEMFQVINAVILKK